MKELKTITAIVKTILETIPATRNSDDLLYYHVCKRINATYVNYPFCQIVQNRKDFGFPSYGSVGRVRRKIQRAYPELKANSRIEGYRSVNEAKYRNYARKVNV